MVCLCTQCMCAQEQLQSCVYICRTNRRDGGKRGKRCENHDQFVTGSCCHWQCDVLPVMAGATTQDNKLTSNTRLPICSQTPCPLNTCLRKLLFLDDSAAAFERR